ncbi:Slp family lipoprotein [Lacimicrobium alkaliphilum]|uniref:Slp family lipoprotein n=1 Tax=Lacimicrobium alkaliphilum TaxID=1526571 RepID=UPI0009E98068|nr:Slp family lipoprotein [Lacimicrobium alkaliphilum]
MKRLLFVAMILGLAGCSTIPEPIQLKDESNLLSYQQVSASPEQTSGNKVRWGGVIARVDNLKENTRLEMLYYPLKSYGRPVTSDESAGRFRVYIDGFLDPMVYKTGRLLTVIGEVGGSESGTVGEHEYVFPVINASGYHMWKNVDRVSVSTVGVGMGYWPGYYSSWYGWHLWPYHQRLIIRSRNSTGHWPTNSGSADSPRPRPESSPSPAPRPRPAQSQPRQNNNRDMGKIQRH